MAMRKLKKYKPTRFKAKDSKYSKDGKTLDTIPASDTKHYLNKIKDALKKYQKIYTEDNKNA